MNKQLITIKGVTISHSYGPLGDFHNNVVRTVEEFFLEKGYLTIAFNFRGSGKSAVEQAGLVSQNVMITKQLLNFY
ncbi:13659_t:CDS:2 [Entrophospora sp. SA101]|nr:13659_t:CDS:2 [Entrophospora sp. SA101]